MTAKEYLSSFQKIQTIIKVKQERIKEVRRSVLTVSPVHFDLTKVQGGKDFDKIGETVSKIVDLEEEVADDIMDLLYHQHEMIAQIHKLNNPLYMELLFKRYYERKDFKQITKEMCISYRYSLDLHKKALKAFQMVNKEVLQTECRYE